MRPAAANDPEDGAATFWVVGGTTAVRCWRLLHAARRLAMRHTVSTGPKATRARERPPDARCATSGVRSVVRVVRVPELFPCRSLRPQGTCEATNRSATAGL